MQALDKATPQDNYMSFVLRNSDNVFKDVIMVAQLDLQNHFFGNRLGRYLETVACCDLLGLHFLNVGLMDKDNKFFEAFPSIIVHNSPSRNHNLEEVEKQIAVQCPMIEGWPWAKAGAWSQRLNFINRLLANLIESYHPNAQHALNLTLDTESFSTVWKATTGLIHINKIKHTAHDETQRAKTTNVTFAINNIIGINTTIATLPFIPDVALAFRCADIVGIVPPSPYGFLHFAVYANYIPPSAKYVYILSEPLDYLNSAKDGEATNCANMGSALVMYLSERFPNATIAIRRGHLMEHFYMFHKAPTVICPPTTFCLYPAMAGSNTVYFQTSSLVNHRPLVRTAFHWIGWPPVLNFGHFKHFTAGSAFGGTEMIKMLAAPLTAEEKIFDFGTL